MIGSGKTCVVVRPGDAYEGKQGLSVAAGISAETAGAEGLCMHLVVIPAGGRGRAHRHESHETAIYVISGEAVMWYGDDLVEHFEVSAGDYLYIPAGTPHLPENTGADDCRVVVARTDPSEQESVVPLPELDELFESRERNGSA
ncbi:MAG: cupin domain-containing protein [Chloroflexia bacterium]